jgi:hypothetical protein
MSLASDIIAQEQKLRAKRWNHDSTRQEIIDHMLPTKTDILVRRAPGERKTNKIFDSTATFGIQVLAQFVQGAVTNQATKWFSQKSRNAEVNKVQAAAAWIDDVTNRELLALKQSNFYKANGEAISDWVGFGDGAVLCEALTKKQRGASPLRFTALACGSYVMCQGIDGRIDTVIRRVSYPAKVAAKEFENLSADTKKLAEKEPYRDVEFLHAIYPRDDADAYGKRAVDAKKLPFASVWVEREKTKVVRESGYRKFPVAVARYDVLSGEIYGRGPGEIALPDAKTLNRADEMMGLVWSQMLDPPMAIKQGTVVGGKLTTRPGGKNTLKDINGVQPLLANMHREANQSTLLRDDKRQSVLRIFHVNEILNLLAREGPEITAFEVSKRMELIQQILGSVFGSLQEDYLATIIDVTFDNMANLGMLAPPPPEVLQGGGFDITYEGPLARSQRSQELLAYQQFAADVQMVSQFKPEMVQLPDWERLLRTVAEIRGVQAILVGEKDFAQMMQQAQQQQALAAQLKAGESVAGSIGKAGPGIKALRDSQSETPAAA